MAMGMLGVNGRVDARLLEGFFGVALGRVPKLDSHPDDDLVVP